MTLFPSVCMQLEINRLKRGKNSWRLSSVLNIDLERRINLKAKLIYLF